MLPVQFGRAIWAASRSFLPPDFRPHAAAARDLHKPSVHTGMLGTICRALQGGCGGHQYQRRLGGGSALHQSELPSRPFIYLPNRHQLFLLNSSVYPPYLAAIFCVVDLFSRDDEYADAPGLCADSPCRPPTLACNLFICTRAAKNVLFWTGHR